MRSLIALFLPLIFLVSCWDLHRPVTYNHTKVWGYRPVYTSDPAFIEVKSMPPQPVNSPAKIYVKGNLIYQNDLGYGIHVIDNSNPSQPVRVGFIQVRGNSEISIKGNYLYANYFTDLVVIDISDWQNAREVKRINNAFSQDREMYTFIPLPEHRVFYECPSYTVGKVQTGWVRDSVYQYCYNP